MQCPTINYVVPDRLSETRAPDHTDPHKQPPSDYLHNTWTSQPDNGAYMYTKTFIELITRSRINVPLCISAYSKKALGRLRLCCAMRDAWWRKPKSRCHPPSERRCGRSPIRPTVTVKLVVVTLYKNFCSPHDWNDDLYVISHSRDRIIIDII